VSEFEYKDVSVVAILVVVILISVTNEDVTVSIEVTSEWNVDDIEEYSFEFVVSSIVFNMLFSVLLEISVLGSSVN
jgi:hypothetical protein